MIEAKDAVPLTCQLVVSMSEVARLEFDWMRAETGFDESDLMGHALSLFYWAVRHQRDGHRVLALGVGDEMVEVLDSLLAEDRKKGDGP